MKSFEELKESTKKDIIIDGLMRSKGVYLLVYLNQRLVSHYSHYNLPTQSQMEYHF